MWRYVLCSTIIIFISILYHYKTNRPASIIDYPEDRYDFVIVGAGTAGCVLASRLSEVPNTSVLLIEAGEYFNWYSIVPLTAPMMQKTPVDWSYKTETQFYSSRALKNSQQLWPRGKGLGGSGQMNYMVHSFGSPEDYETWPSGWNYKDLRPYFGKVSKIMGFSGPSPEPELAKIFTGIDVTKLDGNVTIDKSSSNIKRGTRWSTYHAYLQNAWNRNNLHIITNTLATKILFEDDETTVEGIKVKFKDGTLGRIGVEKSLILCAGAVNTPHLMLVSGLGPYEDLQKSRVHVVKNISQVGKNLYDHLNLPIYVNLKSEISITLQKIDSILELIKYVFNGGGLFATNGIMGTAKRKNSGIVMSGFASADEELLKDIVNFETDTFRNFFPSHSDASHEGFILMVSCLQPKSRGNVTLKTYTIFDPPLIEPAYLENSWDIDCTQEGVNLALDILDLDDLKSLGAKVHTPKIDGCRHFPQDYRDPDYSECIIRSGGLAGHHPGGTCAMGSDENSVLDNKLRVNGINKLRIVDASILPTPISGTPNSVIIAIAERAADVILNIPLKT